MMRVNDQTWSREISVQGKGAEILSAVKWVSRSSHIKDEKETPPLLLCYRSCLLFHPITETFKEDVCLFILHVLQLMLPSFESKLNQQT